MHKVVHREREFVISRAGAYHAGFNAGFNIAEAVNFALSNWLEVVKEGVSSCKCSKDSVTIDIEKFKQVLHGNSEEFIADEPSS